MSDASRTPCHRSIRARWWDYRDAGWYFVTIRAHQRQLVFGDVVAEQVTLTDLGNVAEHAWAETPSIRPEIRLGAWVVMPNHLHGIMIIDSDVNRSSQAESRLWHANTAVRMPHPRGAESGSLGAIVGQFKSVTTKRINRLRDTPGAPVWQRNYYDRIIRDEREYERIHEYIEANPLNWIVPL